MKRQDKLELVFASLIAVSVIVSLIFAIAIVSPEQGVLQGGQSTRGVTSSTVTSVFLSTDTIISISTQTASTTITYTHTSLIPTFSTQVITSVTQLTETIESSSTSTVSSPTLTSTSNTTTTGNQLTSQSTSTLSSTSLTTTSTFATTSATSTTTSGTTSTASGSTTTTVSPSGTSLSPSCSPSEFQLGASTVCTATVTSLDSQFPATGRVSFSSTLPGTFSPSTCTLQGAGPSLCSSTFTPKGPATGYYTVTETYLGDAAHTSSSGNVTLIVPPPEPTLVSCFPSSLAVGSPAYCVVTVTNTVDFPSPTGTVQFTSNMPGSFDTTSCTLSATGSCSVHYTPGPGSSGSTTVVTAMYGGDLYHAPGSGTAQLTVT